VIGYLGSSSFERSAGGSLLNFKRGLAETGYVEGRNVTIEYRWADDQYERLPALAVELVQRRVAVLVAAGSPTALPAKAATTVIPTVFMVASDPVELGLVASLNRPGGNLTGVAYLNAEVAPKRLELLHEFIPSAKVHRTTGQSNQSYCDRAASKGIGGPGPYAWHTPVAGEGKQRDRARGCFLSPCARSS
jgi:putative ABC transport system substrate-binding protein